MSDRHDEHENADPFRVNAELIESLGRCHVLVDDFRSKLIAANSNEPCLPAQKTGEEDGSVG